MTPLTHDDCLRMAAETFLSSRFNGDFVTLYDNGDYDADLLDYVNACCPLWLSAYPVTTIGLIEELADRIFGRLEANAVNQALTRERQ